MKACLDVSYADSEATAACVLFNDWADDEPADELIRRVSPVAPYEPGSFYKRELPCLLAVLRDAPSLEVIVIDGYVWLDADQRPGLGGHLYAALGTPVVGVAKTLFRGAPAIPVVRGSSARPLFVSAAGMAMEEAARCVAAMSGGFRIPTLLKRVDQLSRR